MELETFYPYIMPEVVGCPEPIARMALIGAANEFCRESLSWRSTLTIALVDGQIDYVPTKPSQSHVVAFKSVSVGDRKLTQIPSISGSEKGSEPWYYTSPERGILRVYPEPENPTLSMTVDVAYAPDPSATTLPDYLGLRFIETVAAGAKSRLLMMPAEWGSPQLAAFYTQVFRDGITTASIEEEHGFNPGTLTIKPRAFI